MLVGVSVYSTALSNMRHSIAQHHTTGTKCTDLLIIQCIHLYELYTVHMCPFVPHQVVPMHVLESNNDFMEYVINSNNRSVCVCVCVHARVCVCMCVCVVFVCMHVCAHAHIRMCIHVYPSANVSRNVL